MQIKSKKISVKTLFSIKWIIEMKRVAVVTGSNKGIGNII